MIILYVLFFAAAHMSVFETTQFDIMDDERPTPSEKHTKSRLHYPHTTHTHMHMAQARIVYIRIYCFIF
jgi:hypothetical protein